MFMLGIFFVRHFKIYFTSLFCWIKTLVLIFLRICAIFFGSSPFLCGEIRLLSLILPGAVSNKLFFAISVERLI